MKILHSQLKNFILNNLNNIFFLFFLILISTSLEMIGITALLPIINQFFSQGSQDYLIFNFSSLLSFETTLLIIFLIFFIKSILSIYISYFKNKKLFTMQAEFSGEIAKLYISQNVYTFYKMSSAKFLNKVISQSSYFIQGVISQCINIFVNISLIIGLSILLIINNPLLFMIILLISLTLYLVNHLILKKYINQISKGLVSNSKKRINILQMIFRNLKFIKISKTENYFLKKLQDSLDLLSKNIVYSNIVKEIPIYFLEFIAISLILIFIFSISDLQSSNSMKFSFLLYSVTLIRLFPSINRLISSLNSIQINLKSSADIFDELETNLIKKKNFKLKKLDTLKKISLKNINYKINNLKLFNNFNLMLSKGTLTAITGPSGSGKTTLSEIILGFKKIENGKVYLNDTDLEEVDMDTYYEQIGYVGQEIVLMQDSLFNNLIFGRNIQINNDDIMKILKRLDLKRFINFDVKNLMINEESLNISGGEKQRLGIARALINKPKLLILDEITSSLDNKNAVKIIELLNLIKKDCIILCISHDRTLFPYFDYIVEL